jgi:CheY-like chemotaxis protein/signal transduction histidine kinase
MDRLDQLIERRPPVAAEASTAEVAQRFAAEPDALLLAVTDGEAPVGLIHRQVFEALGPGGAAVARELMDAAPLLVAGDTPAAAFRDQALATRPDALARGFVVTEAGRYLGVGNAVTLLAARSRKSQAAQKANVILTQALAEEVLRQLADAQTFVDGLTRQALPGDARVCADALSGCFSDIHRLMQRAGALHAAEMGLEALDPRPTLLREVMDSLDQRWADRAARAGVTLLTAYDGAPDLAAEIDPDRLGDMFDALVERALSETRRGAVEATLCARPALEGLTLEGRVRDGGATLEPGRLARVFDAMGSGAPLNIGMGMAHAATLAVAMNGVIRAEPNPGAGTSVIFEMIAPEAAPEARDPATTIVPTTAHILIVDDNATNRMVAEALCEMFDCTSEQVGDGVEAVEAVQAGAFDLILMDIKMPRMDGVAATRAIRAMAGPIGQIPIVALTANADPADVRGYIEAGMNDVVEKPIKAERLLTVLDKVLNGVTAQDSAAA